MSHRKANTSGEKEIITVPMGGGNRRQQHVSAAGWLGETTAALIIKSELLHVNRGVFLPNSGAEQQGKQMRCMLIFGYYNKAENKEEKSRLNNQPFSQSQNKSFTCYTPSMSLKVMKTRWGTMAEFHYEPNKKNYIMAWENACGVYRLGSQKLIAAVSVADYSMVRMLSAQLLRGTDCMNTSRPHLRDLSFRSVRESRTWSAMIKEVTAQNDLCVFQKRLVLIFIWLQNIKIQKDHKSFILSMFTKKVIHTGNWASLC